MARSHRATYQKRNRSANESKRHPGCFCPRCSLRLTKSNPLAAGRRHCQMCEQELTAGRIIIGLYATGG